MTGQIPSTEPSEQAWLAWVTDNGYGPEVSGHPLVREAFMAGWDSGYEQATVDPPPPGPQGGF